MVLGAPQNDPIFYFKKILIRRAFGPRRVRSVLCICTSALCICPQPSALFECRTGAKGSPRWWADGVSGHFPESGYFHFPAIPKINEFSVPFLLHFWSILAPKMVPKSIQNRSKNGPGSRRRSSHPKTRFWDQFSMDFSPFFHEFLVTFCCHPEQCFKKLRKASLFNPHRKT